jgi:hypothetical protein
MRKEKLVSIPFTAETSRKVSKIAQAEKRAFLRQAQILIEEALEARELKEATFELREAK